MMLKCNTSIFPGQFAMELGRSARLVQMTTKCGIRIELAEQCLSCSGEKALLAKLLLSLMGAFAQCERSSMRRIFELIQRFSHVSFT